MSIAATLYDAIPYGEEYRWGGQGKTLLFDLACRLAPRVPLIKLVKLDRDVCPYLAPLIVPTLVCRRNFGHTGGHANYYDNKGGLQQYDFEGSWL